MVSTAAEERSTMNSTAQMFFKSGILLLIVGMGAGIFMAASHDHTIAPAHAHLNLIGFVVTCVYGTYYALFPAKAEGLLPKLHWAGHTLAAVAMFPALAAVLYGRMEFEPVVALASIVAFVAALIFAFVVFRPVRATASALSPATA